MVFVGGMTAYAQLGLGMVPMRVELKMAPGEQYSGTLKLSNESGSKTRVRGEVLDFNLDEQGTPQFERNLPRETATSCKNWLSLNPMETEIEQGGFLTVRYTVRLPSELNPGSYNCAAGFTTLPPADQISSGMGMRIAVRVVGAIYVVVGTPPLEGGLKEIKMERIPKAKDSDPEAGWRAVVVMENSGAIYYRPAGDLFVLDEKGEVMEKLSFPSLPVLPRREQRFLFPLKASLADGKYTIKARVDIGTDAIQETSLVVDSRINK